MTVVRQLADQLRQCRRIIEDLHVHGFTFKGTTLRNAIREAMSFDPLSPDAIADAERWERIGELVERMHTKYSGDWGLDSCGKRDEYPGCVDVYNDNGHTIGSEPEVLAALEAALQPKEPQP